MGNRIIKESICTSDSVDELSWFEEVLFYRLIVNCDDFGRFDGRTAVIKNRLFPLKDNVTTKAVDAALQRLASVELVVLYEFEGKPYLHLPSWDKHQTIRAKRSKYPAPEDGMQRTEIICKQMNADESKCSRNPIQSESNSNPNPNPKKAPAAASALDRAMADFADMRKKIKKPLTYWILLVRVLPPVAFTIPLYTMFSKLNILYTRTPVILACILINIPLIIWFMISFYQDLPVDIDQSAQIDGATEWQLYTRIILPLVLPGIAAIAMLSFMYAWNEYTYSIIFVQTPRNYTVPLTLAVLNTEDNLTNFGLVAAGGVISVIPITLFVIFAQNYLISGLSSGAVKE